MATGIVKRHSRGCATKQGKRCNCNAGYEASVYSKREGRKIRKTFAREAEARSWRSNALSALEAGALRSSKPTTVRQAWEAWIAAAREGSITNRSRKPYKPSALRSYDQAMRLRVLDVLGSRRLSEVRRADLQAFADKLSAEGLNPSTVQVTFLPIRAIFRQALSLEEIAANPCAELHLPAVRGRRERFASPAEAAELIAAIPNAGDRAIWATAMYGGLRRGELRALRREDVDLAGGVIQVRRGWDPVEGEIDLKSEAGRRKVPIAAVLRDFLIDRLAESDKEPHERIFGERRGQAFSADKLQMRADAAWKAENARRQKVAEQEGSKPEELERITLHACRHTYASLMIAAGVNAKALSTFMGHARISITLDRYGHLMPGSEAESAALLDDYLSARMERAEDSARSAGGVLTGA